MTPFKTELFADCVTDILEACSRINRYTDGLDDIGFACNEMVQDAVAFNMRVIGACARTLENHLPQFMELDTGLPVRFSYPARDASHGPGWLAHRVPELWQFVCAGIPMLVVKLRAARLTFLEAAGGQPQLVLAQPGHELQVAKA